MVPLLNVEDVPRSTAFYRDGLGFEVVREADFGEGVIWSHVKLGDVDLMLNAPDGAQSDHRRERPTYGETVFYFTVEDAAAFRQTLLDKGLSPEPLTAQDWGMDDFMLRDPDGYELAFGSAREG